MRMGIGTRRQCRDGGRSPGGRIAPLGIVGLAVLICVAPLASVHSWVSATAPIGLMPQAEQSATPAASALPKDGRLLFVRSAFTEAEAIEKILGQIAIPVADVLPPDTRGLLAIAGRLCDGRVLLSRRVPLVVPQRC